MTNRFLSEEKRNIVAAGNIPAMVGSLSAISENISAISVNISDTSVSISDTSENIPDMSESIPDMSGIILAIFENELETAQKHLTINYKSIN